MKPFVSKILISLFILVFIFRNEYSVLAQVEEKSNASDKSSLIIGYQIGGLSYLGVNYEYKLNKVVGIHAGVGYTSFTSGLKFHLSDCATCPFLNLSYKDLGFGSFGTLGAEFSANLVSFKKDHPIGLFIQFGYGYILYISESRKNEMYGLEEPPEGMFTYGIGVRFNW